MKTSTPFRSQKNRADGMFSAQALGSAQESGRPVDMVAAKADIRRQRRMMSGELQREEREKAAQERKIRALRAWWNRRRNWTSVRIDNRIGKLNPAYRYSGWVEFPDGTQKWVDDLRK